MNITNLQFLDRKLVHPETKFPNKIWRQSNHGNLRGTRDPMPRGTPEEIAGLIKGLLTTILGNLL